MLWGQADSRGRARLSRDRICQVGMRDREGPGLRGMILLRWVRRREGHGRVQKLQVLEWGGGVKENRGQRARCLAGPFSPMVSKFLEVLYF